jgi:hypothetical protein
MVVSFPARGNFGRRFKYERDGDSFYELLEEGVSWSAAIVALSSWMHLQENNTNDRHFGSVRVFYYSDFLSTHIRVLTAFSPRVFQIWKKYCINRSVSTDIRLFSLFANIPQGQDRFPNTWALPSPTNTSESSPPNGSIAPTR